MTERQARAEGLQFHGAYGHNKEDIKARAAEIRKEGFKAVVVDSGRGYSVYVETAYFQTRHARQLLERINSREALVAEAKRKYQLELGDIEASHIAATQNLETYREALEAAGKDTKWITKELKQEN